MRPADNPFRVSRLEGLRYRFLDGTFDQVLARLESNGFRGAIVGPEGSGKSTLLRELGAALRFRVRSILLREEDPSVPWDVLAGLGPADAVLLDGSEQMRPLDRLRFRWIARRAGALVITSHAEPWLPVIHRTRTTPELLAGLVEELGAPAPPSDTWSRHGGDVRAALRALYDAV